VLIQLTNPNRADPGKRMGGRPDLAIPVSQVSVDPTATLDMLGIVGVPQGKALQDAELRFDQVQPRGFGRRPDRMDAQALERREQPRVIVDVVEVVQNHEQTRARVASPQPLEGLDQIGHALALSKQTAQAVGMDVVEAEEHLRAFEAPVGGAHARGSALGSPGHATHRPEFERPPLVEADYRRARRPPMVELADAFFFLSKWGSREVFQVRMRCADSPSRRNSRRTHSSVTSGNSPWLRQYAASLGTDQRENGNPRSSGLESATSTSSRSCPAWRIGGRPFGLGTCSKVLKPLSLKRWTQSYAPVKWQPTRSAASMTL